MNSMKSSYQTGLCAQADAKYDSPKTESRASTCLSSLELNLISLSQIVAMLESRLRTVTNDSNKIMGSSPTPPRHPPLPQESAKISDRVERAAARVDHINADLNDLIARLEI